MMGGHSNRGYRYRLTSPEIYSARFLIFRERALPRSPSREAAAYDERRSFRFHHGNRQGIDDGNCPLRLGRVRDYFQRRALGSVPCPSLARALSSRRDTARRANLHGDGVAALGACARPSGGDREETNSTRAIEKSRSLPPI